MIDLIINSACAVGGVALQTFYPKVGDAILTKVKSLWARVFG